MIFLEAKLKGMHNFVWYNEEIQFLVHNLFIQVRFGTPQLTLTTDLIERNEHTAVFCSLLLSIFTLKSGTSAPFTYYHCIHAQVMNENYLKWPGALILKTPSGTKLDLFLAPPFPLLYPPTSSGPRSSIIEITSWSTAWFNLNQSAKCLRPEFSTIAAQWSILSHVINVIQSWECLIRLLSSFHDEVHCYALAFSPGVATARDGCRMYVSYLYYYILMPIYLHVSNNFTVWRKGCEKLAVEERCCWYLKMGEW